VDSATEVLPPALQYLGKRPYSANPADYAGVPKLLAALRPHVTQFSAADYIDDLASGKLCLAMGYSGDLNIARRRAREAKTGRDVQALVPRAPILFVDAMAIPMDAPHPRNAHRFIDFILRPEVHAGLTNAVFYANPNKASLPFVDPEVAGERTVFLPAEDLRRAVTPDAISNETRRLMTRHFEAFKAGR
jgi:putrescine transport system substrate-binding protein